MENSPSDGSETMYMFAAKVPGQHVVLPYEARALLMCWEIFSALNIWGARKGLDHDPNKKELALYYISTSADDPDNPVHKSGAEQFAEFFPAPMTKEEERRANQSFMPNM